jgi:ribonuclease HI
MYFDGSFTLNSAEGGVVLISPKGDRLLYVIRLHFHATNNVVKYEALVNCLRITAKLGVHRLYIYGGSRLIVNQVMEESNSRDSRMDAYRQEVRKLEEKFDSFELHHILQQDNEAADALDWLKLSHEPPPPGVFAQDLLKPSIRLKEDIPIPKLEISPNVDNLVPALGTPSGKDGPVLTSEVNSGASAKAIEPNLEPKGEIVAIIGLPNLEVNWQKPISE